MKLIIICSEENLYWGAGQLGEGLKTTACRRVATYHSIHAVFCFFQPESGFPECFAGRVYSKGFQCILDISKSDFFNLFPEICSINT